MSDVEADLFGSLVGTSTNSRSETFYQPPDSSFGVQLETLQDLHLRKNAQRAWDDLPYIMMRLTEAHRPAHGPSPYWRDQHVQLGDFELSLTTGLAEDGVPTYTATYVRGERRRCFILHPSVEGDELHWSAPGLSNGSKLNSTQLADKLLRKLVGFHVRSLSAPAPTSSASPGPVS